MKIIATTIAPRSAMPPMVAPAMMPAFLEPSPPPLDGEGSADVVEAGKGGTVPPDDELSIVVGVGVDVDDSSEEVDSSVDVNKRVILGVVAPDPLMVPGLVAYRVSPV